MAAPMADQRVDLWDIPKVVLSAGCWVAMKAVLKAGLMAGLMAATTADSMAAQWDC
jgi:hypothetical protein